MFKEFLQKAGTVISNAAASVQGKEINTTTDTVMNLLKQRLDNSNFTGYEYAMQKGEHLCIDTGASAPIVKLIIALSALQSAEAKKILDESKIDLKSKEIITKARGSVKPYPSKEAEVAANADVYRFISPFGFLTYVTSVARTNPSFRSLLNPIDYKLDEKFNLLTLSSAKQELEESYKALKLLLSQARN